MKRNFKLGMFLSFTGLFCLFGLNVYADMYFESKTTRYTMGRGTGPEKLEKTYVTADKMKTMQNAGRITIIRLDKELMWNIDSASKTYMEMAFKDVKERAQQSVNAMKDAIAKMPPEQRKQMEQFMPQLGVPKKTEVKIEKTGKKKDVSGYKCELIIATMDTTTSEMWVTEQIKYDKDAKKYFEAMSSIFSDIASFQRMISIYQSFLKIEGFPMETKITTTSGTKSFSSISIVSKVEQKKINDSEFELPEGLKKAGAGLPH